MSTLIIDPIFDTHRKIAASIHAMMWFQTPAIEQLINDFYALYSAFNERMARQYTNELHNLLLQKKCAFIANAKERLPVGNDQDNEDPCDLSIFN